jgi:prevent-host-death family protein
MGESIAKASHSGKKNGTPKVRRDMKVGIRELRDNLSRCIRRVEAGHRIAVTAHGRVVAELVPPGAATRKTQASRWDELIATGILHPPVETGDPFEDWPDIRLPPGTAAELIDGDRGEM